MRASSVVCLSASLVVAVTASLFAAPQQSPRVGETIDVSIVNVDVVVTDRNGNRVRGLTRNDFELSENGTLQPLSNFAEYRARTGDARTDVVIDAFGAPVGDSTPAPPRSIVLFVDAFALPRHDAEPMFNALNKMVRDAVRDGDVASIVSWNPIANRPEVVVAYTSDTRRLTRAIDNLRDRRSVGAGASPALAARGTASTFLAAGATATTLNLFGGPRNPDARTAAMREEGLTIQPGVLANRVSGARHVAGQVTEEALNVARYDAMRSMFDQRRKIGVIKALISSMSTIEGRKALILATHRLGYYAGAEYFYAFGYNDVPAHDRGTFDMRPLMASMIDTANAAGVTIYPIYPEGLGTEGALPTASAQIASLNLVYDYQVLTNETSALSNVALKTGGMMAWGAKDIATLLPRINDDLDSYYSLGYRSEPASEDSRRSISVKTKNGDYVLRARREYAATTEETKMRHRVTAAVFREPDGAPRLNVKASFGRLTKEGKNVWRVPLTLRIPMSQLVALPSESGQKAGSMSIYVASSASLGTEAEVTRQTQPFSYGEVNADAIAAQYVTYDVELRIDKATDYVGVAVVDDISRDAAVLRLKLPRR